MTFSIILKSQLEGAKRLDAEYYQPELLRWDELIKLQEYSIFGNLINKLTDYTANSSFAGLKNNVRVTDNIEYAKWIRIQNLDNNNFIDNIRYVDEKSYNFLRKSVLLGGEILISKTGEYLGKAYIMPKLNEKATLADNIFLLDLKDKSLNEYLVIYISCKIGQKLLTRKLQGTGQPTIIKESLRELLIPLPDNNINLEIKKLYNDSKIALNDSHIFYQQAEELLLQELGLKDFRIEDDLSYIVNFSEVQKADRMDAEYFHPKYSNLESRIKNYELKILGELVSMKKGFEPGSEAYQEEGKLFIRVSSLSRFGIESSDQKYLSEELYQKLAKDFQPQLGEILLTKDATPGIAYVLKEPIDGIVSGGILRLKIKENIEQEYLVLCINSIIGQMQAERDAGGSVIAHWKLEEIKNLLIPLLPEQKQIEIADLVKKSHEARKKSKELLEQAKKEVEELIDSR